MGGIVPLFGNCYYVTMLLSRMQNYKDEEGYRSVPPSLQVRYKSVPNPFPTSEI